MYSNKKQIELNEMDFTKVDGCWAFIPKPSREIKQEEIKTKINN